MSRRKTKDVVDLMKQRPDKRLTEGFESMEHQESCRYCDAFPMEEGPHHERKCPRFVEDEELDDSQFWKRPEENDDEENILGS